MFLSAVLNWMLAPRTGTRPHAASAGPALGVMLAAVVSIAGGVEAIAQGCDPAEIAKLLASDGAAGDSLGYAVCFDGDTAVIGADEADDNGDKSGAAYVFTRTGGVWSQQAKLLPDDGAADDYFGMAVALSGDTALIGAALDDDQGSRSGAVYVFMCSGGVWTQQAKLLPEDGAKDTYFGDAVSLDGDTALIGARYHEHNGVLAGAAYVFTRAGGVWTQQAELLADDGVDWDFFGDAVSVEDDTAVVGAPSDDDIDQDSGSVYVFTRSGTMWMQQAKLLPADGAKWDRFGWAASLSNDTVVIGAYRHDDNGAESGTAYVFTRDGGVWTEQAELLPEDGRAYAYFGHDVSLDGDTVVIGAGEDDENGIESGAAYVFTRDGGVWTEQAKLLAADGGGRDHFGTVLSLHGDTVIIGALGDDDRGTQAGAAYAFDLGCGGCPADVTGDGLVDTRDFIAFLGAWSAGDPLADWDENGVVDTRDFVAYLGDWAAGCP